LPARLDSTGKSACTESRFNLRASTASEDDDDDDDDDDYHDDYHDGEGEGDCESVARYVKSSLFVRLLSYLFSIDTLSLYFAY
jgi:hypothetical protein